MSNQQSRRGFLARLGLGTFSLVTLPAVSFSKTKDTKDDIKLIKRVWPLGFQWQTADPFLFCVHHEDHFPKGNTEMAPDPKLLKGRRMGSDFIVKDGWRMYHGEKYPGFPHHPHRGFETITVVRKGMVDHADSIGAAGRYGNGDVQWMTAGKGVQHSEMFPLVNQDKDNPMELFQIWINLPKKNKMVDPHFKMLWREEIPTYKYKDTNGHQTKVEVVAGTLAGHKAPAPPPDSWAFPKENEVAIYNIKMDANAVWTLPKASKGINRTIYFYEGPKLKLDGNELDHYHAVEVEPDQDVTIQNFGEEAGILVLQGKPIAEPVVQYGPFVMNTKQEIKQAYDDYHKTKFGGWPWKMSGQVHEKDKGRFAKHADGRVVKK